MWAYISSFGGFLLQEVDKYIYGLINWKIGLLFIFYIYGYILASKISSIRNCINDIYFFNYVLFEHLVYIMEQQN